MTRERRVTRTARVSYRAAVEGMATLPDGIRYLWVGGPKANGERPHAATSDTSDGACTASLMLTLRSIDPLDIWCTREDGHDGEHVAHVERGLPIAAWTDDTVEAGS